MAEEGWGGRNLCMNSGEFFLGYESAFIVYRRVLGKSLNLEEESEEFPIRWGFVLRRTARLKGYFLLFLRCLYDKTRIKSGREGEEEERFNFQPCNVVRFLSILSQVRLLGCVLSDGLPLSAGGQSTFPPGSFKKKMFSGLILYDDGGFVGRVLSAGLNFIKKSGFCFGDVFSKKARKVQERRERLILRA
ncbi:hypothetical protein NPIL_416251 [Nephila pilipes]|uniref:Uncharacterized protein n=1 Tax=Nephila pilipes TaxID=299642 RepID=A0A8X6PLM0_NEPPI|nr:hypothetical protein NPIL_416251 [Nephila pilipes]